MTKWEYLRISRFTNPETKNTDVATLFPDGTSKKADGEGVDALLNIYGAEGWELVTSYTPNDRGSVHTMKRPIEA